MLTPVTWNGEWWKKRNHTTTPAATSKITVSAVPSTRRVWRSRPWRGGGPGRCPVRHTLSAAPPAPLSGTPGPYRSTSPAPPGPGPPAGGPPGPVPPGPYPPGGPPGAPGGGPGAYCGGPGVYCGGPGVYCGGPGVY